jgi:hypothetical protein
LLELFRMRLRPASETVAAPPVQRPLEEVSPGASSALEDHFAPVSRNVKGSRPKRASIVSTSLNRRHDQRNPSSRKATWSKLQFSAEIMGVWPLAKSEGPSGVEPARHITRSEEIVATEFAAPVAVRCKQNCGGRPHDEIPGART